MSKYLDTYKRCTSYLDTSYKSNLIGRMLQPWYKFYLEPSLTLTDLTTLLENINVGYSRQWWYTGSWLDIPQSKLNAIEGQHSRPDQRSRACWDLYVSDHPSPSWKAMAYALYRWDQLEELEVVQKKYLKGE